MHFYVPIFCPVLFVNQKMAYEIRIGDWSSDVCSSVLARLQSAAGRGRGRRAHAVGAGDRSRRRLRRHDRVRCLGAGRGAVQAFRDHAGSGRPGGAPAAGGTRQIATRRPSQPIRPRVVDVGLTRRWPWRRRSRSTVSDGSGGRSEEHTSELQSLMRTSYDVFCLKKKKMTQAQTTASKYSNDNSTKIKKKE